MPKPLRTLFVVADGARARWVERSDAANDFVTVRRLETDHHHPGQPEGVVFMGVAGRRATVEERSTAVREHRARFARQVAEAINQQVTAGGFDRMAVIAPAPVIRAIRDRLTVAASSKVARTLAKDLTGAPDHELGKWLRPLERD